MPGEASSIFLKEEKVGPVELATISFGQRFEVTPIQMVTMLSTIANKGIYVRPRIVKTIIDSQTNEKKEIEPIYENQVIAEKTAENVLSMMESVVSEGTGKNAKVEGVAPIDNPEMVILITLYNPTGEGGHQGGGVAAPVAGKIFRRSFTIFGNKKRN